MFLRCFPKRRMHRAILGVSILMFLVAVCQFTYYIANGDVTCSSFDLQWHMTPCRSILSADKKTQSIRNITFSADSQLLAVTAPESVSLWNISQGTQLQTFPAAINDTFDWGSLAPDGHSIALLSTAGLQVINVATGQPRFISTIPHNNAQRILFSSDGNFLAWSKIHDAGNDQLMIIDAFNGQVLFTFDQPFTFQSAQTRFTPDNTHVLMWVRKPDNQSELWSWEFATNKVTLLANDPLGIASDGGIIYTIDGQWLKYVNETHTYKMYQQHIRICGRTVAFLSHPPQIITLDYNNDLLPSLNPTMCINSLEDDHRIWQSQNQGYCLAISPDEQYAALCTGRGVQIWDIPADWKR